jgi:hypothetical protein
MERGFDESRRIDDDCRLPVRLANLDQSRDAIEIQEATPRIS